MILSALVLAAAAAFAGSPVSGAAPDAHPEQTLRQRLTSLRQNRVWEVRKAMIGAEGNLRDAVVSNTGDVRKQLADRLPGMSPEPFDLCRSLAACSQAPQSFHVDDEHLIDDALVALARPWLNLQKARGKNVKVVVDPGVGVQLTLEDMPERSIITLEVWPAGTGGFDLVLDDGAEAAKVYARQRAAVLDAPKSS